MSFSDRSSSRTAKRGTMPDIAHESPTQLTGTLDKVGMSDIEVPVRLRDDSGQVMMVPAKADAYVSLDDAKAKGIHMSRLFLSLQAILGEEELNLLVVRQILAAFIGSHASISRSAAVRLSFDLLVRRKALVSANQSWRTYPVFVAGEIRDGKAHFRLGAQVAYSGMDPQGQFDLRHAPQPAQLRHPGGRGLRSGPGPDPGRTDRPGRAGAADPGPGGGEARG
jgi:GTP cyclohydrolase FolE2